MKKISTILKPYDFLTGVFCDGVCCLLFEECHHDIGVQFKTSDSHQDKQRCVGADADEGVVADGDQSRHHCSKHHPGVDGVFPMVGAFKAHYELKYKKETIILMSDIVFVGALINNQVKIINQPIFNL